MREDFSSTAILRWIIATVYTVQVEEKVERDRSKPKNGPVAQQNRAGEDDVGRAVSSYKFRSPDSFSESESVDQSRKMAPSHNRTAPEKMK
ncbi:hypothetical protein U1Q18_042591 [Sarracenia purpurea var. burkii]